MKLCWCGCNYCYSFYVLMVVCLSCNCSLTPRTLPRIYFQLRHEVLCSSVFVYFFCSRILVFFVFLVNSLHTNGFRVLFCLQLQPTNGGRCKFLQSFMLLFLVLSSNICCLCLIGLASY